MTQKTIPFLGEKPYCPFYVLDPDLGFVVASVLTTSQEFGLRVAARLVAGQATVLEDELVGYELAQTDNSPKRPPVGHKRTQTRLFRRVCVVPRDDLNGRLPNSPSGTPTLLSPAHLIEIPPILLADHAHVALPRWLVRWPPTDEAVDTKVSKRLLTIAVDEMQCMRRDAHQIPRGNAILLSLILTDLQDTAAFEDIEDLLRIVMNVERGCLTGF